MITRLSIGDHQQNPYIEAKVLYFHHKGLVFGEWLAHSGKLEEIILNPAKGEEYVMKKLEVGMTVHVRSPRPNTKEGAQTAWRCFLRPLTEQPIYLQEICKPQQTESIAPEPAVEKAVEIEDIEDETVSTVEPKRITLQKTEARFNYVKGLASKSNHAPSDARKFSKALGDVIDWCIANQINPYCL
jgi:hypothetical protein